MFMSTDLFNVSAVTTTLETGADPRYMVSKDHPKSECSGKQKYVGTCSGGPNYQCLNLAATNPVSYCAGQYKKVVLQESDPGGGAP
jgi:hypothetical protein